MRILNNSFDLNIYESIEELEKEDQILLNIARKQLKIAYAPYSRFRVGAALILANGKLFTGSNQENASYSLCICAERVALFNAADKHPDSAVKTLAIVASSTIKPIRKPVTPCGACRQVICEFESRFDQPIRLLLQGESEVYEVNQGAHLLPFSFDRSFVLGE